MFLYSFIFVFLCSFKAHSVLAQDLTVVCNDSGCSSSGDHPLFTEKDIFPGWSLTKVVRAVNDYDEDGDFSVEVDAYNNPGGLGDVLTITIKETGSLTELYRDTLTNFSAAGQIILSQVKGNHGDKDYDFMIELPSWVGDEYQNKTLVFDLYLGYDMVATTSVSPSPNNSLNSSLNSNSGTDGVTDGGVVGGNSAAAAAPTTAPGLASFVFTAPARFMAGILGVSEPTPRVEPNIAGASEENPPEVKGESIRPWWHYLWWLLLLPLFLLFYFLKRKKRQSSHLTKK